LVDHAVNEYINNDDLAYDAWEEFPSRSRLTGEYYLGNQYYAMEPGNDHCFASSMACCQEKLWYPNQIGQDYLGLDVDVEFDTATGMMIVAMVSSSVI